ncbi:ribonucleoside-diphosphate reductase [Candidatus Geothermarchaeota archaeon ex4572_27]|nr:MAG: ribonucleoside-diphosphate reductase [Candidatus Geothermarchaeota archaeon ex4572_27]
MSGEKREGGTETCRIKKIIKRDGRIVDFDRTKIENAIWKAIRATGGTDRELARKLSYQVVEILEKTLKPGEIPTVEGVQDIVEKVLMDNGLWIVAKAYILYRQKRAEIREEKKRILQKDALDEVDKAFDVNALRVLAARYLRKDEKGRLLETPKQLFTRVAVHVTLPDLLYDPRVFSKEGGQPKHEVPEFRPEEWEGKLSIGKYELNRYHLEALYRLYRRLNDERKMKVPWTRILEMLMNGEFDMYERNVEQYYKLMVEKKFLPNTPALANFGNPLGMGSACFVLDIDDSLDSIMETLKRAALIFKAGGGVGYNFSKLRPEGDYVSTTSGVASGPVSFMRLFDVMTEVIKQGGIRRGANIGILNINHPDIEKFIKAKEGNKALRNFNISVMIFPDFWEYYRKNKPYPLINPRTGRVVKTVNPRLLFDMIAYQAWSSAEPGVIFYDNVNKYNPFLKALGPITCTNPCGEVLLYPNESCNLGSINVWRFVVEKEDGKKDIDWNALAETVRIAVRFLDNVVDINKYPLKEIEEATLRTRKIGLGMMGLADLLYELELPYNSEEGRRFMERLMEFINYHSKLASVELAKERGPFPLFDKSDYKEGKLPFAGFYDRKSWTMNWDYVVEQIKRHGLRNGYTTVIAPTGSISMIAGTSSGIEPQFSLVYEKRVTIGKFYYVDPVFEEKMRQLGLYDDQLIKDVLMNRGSIQNIPYIPENVKRIFVTALDISPEDHVRAVAALQKWVDSSISKTINLPGDATVEDVKRVFILAHELGVKDVTVYRYGTISRQVLTVSEASSEEEEAEERGYVEDELEKVMREASAPTASRNITKCPVCGGQIVYQEGCATCVSCGWGVCA